MSYLKKIEGGVERINFFPQYVDVRTFIKMENMIFSMMREKMEGYSQSGRYWEFWEVGETEEGSKFPIMVIDPEGQKKYPLFNPSNYFKKEVTTFIGGVAIYLMAVNHLSFHLQSKGSGDWDKLNNVYFGVYNWVIGSDLFSEEDKSAICAFLD